MADRRHSTEEYSQHVAIGVSLYAVGAILSREHVLGNCEQAQPSDRTAKESGGQLLFLPACATFKAGQDRIK